MSKSLSQRLREAGYTPRDNRIECYRCGLKFSVLMLPIHECPAEDETVEEIVRAAASIGEKK